jgi:hypothetical protein
MLSLANAKIIIIISLTVVWIFFYLASRGVYRIPSQYEMRVIKPLTITTSVLASIYFYNHELAIGITLLCITAIFTALGIVAHPKKPRPRGELDELGEPDTYAQFGERLWKLKFNRLAWMMWAVAGIVAILAAVLAYYYGLKYYFVFLIAAGAMYLCMVGSLLATVYRRRLP